MDLILSSGFLAFARHLGVLRAVTSLDLQPDALVGTSSGALVGALSAAGHELPDIERILSARPALFGVGISPTPWRGLLTAGPLRRRLAGLLPEQFEQLPRPLGLGVCDELGRHRLLTSGPLIDAVLASCAIPGLFGAQRIGPRRCHDGGVVDRVGTTAWRHWRPNRRAVVHIVERSRGALVEPDTTGQLVVRTPRSNARFWSYGDFRGQVEQAYELARRQLEQQLGESLSR